MPSWYPTQQDEISGSFFKEQAEALSEYYDIVVVRILTRYFALFRPMDSRIGYFESGNNAIPVFRITLLCGIFERLLKSFSRYNYWNRTKLENVLRPFEQWYERRKTRRLVSMCTMLRTEKGFVPDIIYAMTAQTNGDDACLLGKAIRKPVILAEHAPFPLPGTLIGKHIKMALSESYAVVCVSRHLERMMVMQGIDFNPIVIGNMIDDDLFKFRPVSRDDGSAFRILIVGAYNSFKDYETFFRAMKLLTSISSQLLEITIAGYNFNKDYSVGENALKAKLSQYQLIDRVKLVPQVSRRDMLSYYHGADVLVSTSIQETFGLSCAEALACGIPVFATRSGGVEDFIDETCGRLYELRDYRSLAQGLLDYMGGKFAFDRAAISKTTRDRFGKCAFIARISKVFSEALIENTGYNG